ncbi:MAG: type Z 30S ribosomal protein S14 [Patescibacteria group bacterium]
MGKTAWIAKNNMKPKFKVRHRNRCGQCARPRGYMRKFGLCRICFRKYASAGQVPGVFKASW